MIFAAPPAIRVLGSGQLGGFAQATISGTASVPGRRPRSWPPPKAAAPRAGVFRSAPHANRPHALGPVDLVPAEGNEVPGDLPQRLDLLAEGLGGVGMEKRLAAGHDLANFLDGLQHARLVVGMHHGNQERIGP